MSQEQRPMAPRSRGAILAALREMRKVGAQPPQEEPEKPRGRAAMLAFLKQTQVKPIGRDIEREVIETSEQPFPSPRKEVLLKDRESQIDRLDQTVSQMQVKELVSFKGQHGKTLQISANYIKLFCDSNRGVYEYEVIIEPVVDSKYRRQKLVSMVVRNDLDNVKLFDGGSVLYLPTKITDDRKTFITTLPGGDETFEVTFVFKKKKNMYDSECLHLYNILFKRIMYILLYKQMGRSFFDPTNKHMIPQHQLEVLPGYAVSVDQMEGGLFLCLDTQHKVMRTQNVYSYLMELNASDPSRFKEIAVANLIGSCVFTKYNNRTYTIDDINWELTPKDTFPTRDGGQISFLEYYERQHALKIRDINQPMLVNRSTVKTSTGEKEDRLICLVPELCHMTGLTESMRNDFKVMKDVAQYTRVTPQQRVNAMHNYLNKVRESPEAQNVLADWGLSIDDQPVQTTARQLENEQIFFGDGKSVQTNNNADWSRATSEFSVCTPVDIRDWIVFYTARDANSAKNFAQLMVRLSGVMGCRVNQPKPVQLPNDRTETYMSSCREYINDNVQIVVFVVPTIRQDRYAIIKKMCCNVIPVPSQVVTSRVLSNTSKVRAIVQKIALQMVAKMGGSLWNVKCPFKGWMVAGMDVYHGKGDKSVCGLVCSLNESLSRYMTLVNFQDQEMGDHLKISFTKMIERYKNENGSYPDKLIIYRDGVSDGELEKVKRYEVQQFKSVIEQFGLETKICFITVQKRINTRIFALGNETHNPPPGTVLDHTMTRRTIKDFFIVSQSVRQGTVNPTHYIVLHDETNMRPDIIQRLTYKMCHLYYNWAGTVRVPAPCQYAHKVAGLVGQHIKIMPSHELWDKLYYL